MWDGSQRVPVLGAPTASGKTAAALALAEHVPLEVVSADAMQVYRGLDVGTAKPSGAERARVAHHLVDVVEPTETFDVARFVELAEAAISDVLARGRVPLVTGGTGFYIEALIGGLPGTPRADRAVQSDIEEELARRGLDALLDELAAASPLDAERTQRNPRRLVRALEVLRRTGRAPSEHPTQPPRFGYAAAVMDPGAEVLAERIRLRTRAQLERGWLDEVGRLAGDMDRWSTAAQAIGYDELRHHLAGALTLEEAVTRIDQATLQYAKRQRTWFRHRPAGAVRFAGTGEECLEQLASWLNHTVPR